MPEPFNCHKSLCGRGVFANQRYECLMAFPGVFLPMLADDIAHLFARMDSKNRKLNGSVLDAEFC